MLAYYGTKISPHMTTTPEGYLLCQDVPIARTGDMTYAACELKLDDDPNRLVTVHRYEEDVFAPEAIASFEGKDITAGHPTEDVGPENHAAYSKGHLQNVRRSGDYLVADLLVKDANLISDIRNNVVREVSCGYRCEHVPDGGGYRQVKIRGNHVAVVPCGRAGHEVAIRDHKKGKSAMATLTETILRAFGHAAKDAKDDAELTRLISSAVRVLDSEPAPEPEKTKEPAPAADELGAKLDKILERLEKLEQAKETKPTLDALIEQLSGEGGEKGPVRDAALAMLKSVQPVVAGIEDQTVRDSVSQALADAFAGKDVMGNIVQATQQSAPQVLDEAMDFEKTCAAQKEIYDARNPHKQKEA